MADQILKVEIDKSRANLVGVNIQRTWVLSLGFLIAFAWGASFFEILTRSASLFSLYVVAAIVIVSFSHKLCMVGIAFRRTLRRLRRFPVWCWFSLALVILWGGVICMPSNYDALSYRIPRMLQWLAEGQIYWIDTPDIRQNVLGVTWELVALPLLCIGGEGRFLFLINFIAFLLMPGLVFGVLRALGLPRRSCWWAMWLLPAAYIVVLQAGGISSDLLAGVLFLASIRFALLFKFSGRVSDLLISSLAIGMVTGVKQLYLPLGLPWLIALIPSVQWALRKPAILALAVGICVSFVPTMILNFKNTGDALGLNAFPQDIVSDIPAAAVGNSVYFAGAALSPPINPLGAKLSELATRLLSEKMLSRVQATFEDGFRSPFPEMPIEEFAGIGLFLTLALLAWVIAGRKWTVSLSPLAWALCASTFLALAIIMLKTGTATIGRYSLPHFSLLVIPLLAFKPSSSFLSGYIWCGLVIAVFLGSFALLVLSPARQILPVALIVEKLAAQYPENKALRKASTIYSVFGKRGDTFGQIRRNLPLELSDLAVWTRNSPVGTLWLPYGRKRVFEVDSLKTAQLLRQKGVRVLIIQEKIFVGEKSGELSELRRIWQPTKESAVRISMLAAVGEETFLVWE